MRRLLLLLIPVAVLGGEPQVQSKMNYQAASLRVLVLTFHVADTTSQTTMAWGEPGSLPDSISVGLMDGKGVVSGRVYHHGRPDPAAVAR